MLAFVSMFGPPEEAGVLAFHVDAETGSLTPAKETLAGGQTFFLAIAPDCRTLYSVRAEQFGGQNHEEIVAWRIRGRDGLLEEINRQSTCGTASCFLSLDVAGRTLLVANYTTGSVAALPVKKDGSLGKVASFYEHEGASVHPDRQAAAHAHSIIASPENRFAYAADLGTDRIVCYRLDADLARLTPHSPGSVKVSLGAGPRHVRFHPAGRQLYVIHELANSVSVYDYDAWSGSLTERQGISTLPPHFLGESAAADLAITPGGDFLYATNRGHDSIAVFRICPDGLLEALDIVPSLGAGPQNLAITPDGRLMFCANMGGGNVAVFRIDAATGQIVPASAPTAVRKPACIALIE